jgi:putative transposase
MEYSTSFHRPIHLYIDDTWYFITGSTIDRKKLFNSDAHLEIWKEAFLKSTNELGVNICAWVMLPNHYHILIQFRFGRDLSIFTKRLHGTTSRRINLLDDSKGRKIWYSYWDTCVGDEKSFWARFNYIHFNPVRHGYVQQPDEWEYSSYRFFLQEKGEEWLAKCWFDYPADNLLPVDKY